MIEYVGLPGTGKSTRMTKDFPEYSRSISLSSVPLITLLSNLFFFSKIYGFRGYKRIYHSLKITVVIIKSKDVLVLDQGLFQIYLSHCALISKIVCYQELSEIRRIIQRNCAEIEILLIDSKLSLEVINKRLKNRNGNRREGLTPSFYYEFGKNVKKFESWVYEKENSDVKLSKL